MILRDYLRPLKLKKIDTLILGCTHYPVMANKIRQIMGKNCQIINPGKIVADSLIDYLKRHSEIESLLSHRGQVKFFTTDDPARFKTLGSKFLGKKIEQVARINLSN